MIAVAPGKVMLAGEYAVLRGESAVVLAVDRHVVARRSDYDLGEVPEASAAIELAVREGWLVKSVAIRLDRSALCSPDGKKLGLGSSAASTVAALALAFELQGHRADEHRSTITELARRAHRQVQHGGSGIDVIASAHGGVQDVSWPGGASGDPVVSPVSNWGSVPWAVVWSGTEARTSVFVEAVSGLRARSAAAYAGCIDAIAAATTAWLAAVARGDAPAAVRAVRSHATALGSLGDAAGVPIVTAAMRRFDTAIEPLGAACKPSGAGGGDIVLVMAHDDHGMTDALAAARTFGFTCLGLGVEDAGVRVYEDLR